MKLHKLKQQLLREIQRHPKRAAVLGVLLLTALYFWAPLLKPLVVSEEPETAVTAGPEREPANQPPKPKTAKTHTWRQVLNWMADDPRLRPSPGITRNPFPPIDTPTQTPRDENGEDKPNDKKPSVVRSEPVEEKTELTLTGTMVSSRRRVALINGRAYTEGQTVSVSKNRSYRIAEIMSKQVVLTRDGKPLVLAVAGHAGDDSLEIETMAP